MRLSCYQFLLLSNFLHLKSANIKTVSSISSLINYDLPICTQRFLRMVSSVFCLELRRQSQPQQFLSTSLSFSFDLIWLIFSYTSSILNFSYHRFLSPLETCPQGSFSPMISNLSIPT